ncbi:MAG: winged helix-turn-helix domain-containing protein [Phycisphaerales bacterium]
MSRGATDVVVAADAARLLLDGAGLLKSPDRPAGPRSVSRVIDDLGFVQVDAITTVARAHHHILMTRLDRYRPATMTRLVEHDRSLFEHWTHDASVIPVAWWPFWRRRFAAARERGTAPNAWWAKRIGPDAPRTVRRVVDRIRRRGPSTAGEIAESGRASTGGWWRWTPEKCAVEYAWRAGILSISARREFTKVYDLATRAYPELQGTRMPSPRAHTEWACRAAMERLGVATASEIAGFLEAVDVHTARAWAKAAERRGELVPVTVAPTTIADAGFGTAAPRPVQAWATHDWPDRLAAAPPAPDRARLLSPFDPLIRDRKRAARLFGFDYRFEAFVPQPKRRFGYYVLPVLDGEQFAARVNAKLDREASRLKILGCWWEPGVRPTKARQARLADAVERYAGQCGAAGWDGSLG